MPRLRIISVNDVYSLENLPRLKTLVDSYRSRQDSDALLVVLAGDFLAPSLLSSIDFGRGMVDCIDAVGITHVVLGNHEDDIPPEELQKRLAELSATCIGTNIRSVLDLPRHVIVDVAGVQVGLVGVVMADSSVYRGRPFGGAELVPANVAALEETASLLRTGVRAVIPITHQSLGDDRALASAQTEPPFPAIIGGHEHVPFLVQVGDTWIVKAGTEAIHAAITEVVWTSLDARPTVTTRLEDVALHAEDEALRARVDQHMATVRELAAATLYWVPAGTTLSSKHSRSQQTTMGTLICTRLRDCLGAETSVFNGGGIRGGRDYVDRFTYGDIEAEVPFDNEVVVVGIPGRVIEEAIRFSRASAPVESGAFLHVDDRLVLGPDGSVIAIAGAPFEPERFYSVALVRELLLGLDSVEPLVRWAAANPLAIPPSGAGRQPKLVLVQSFALGIWHELGGFDAIDTNGDDQVTPSEVAEAVIRLHPSQAPATAVADLVISAIDADADRIISRADAILRDAARPREEHPEDREE